MVTPSSLVPAEVVAEALHVRRETVLKMAREGRVPSVRLTEKLIRFDVADVLNAVKGPSPPTPQL